MAKKKKSTKKVKYQVGGDADQLLGQYNQQNDITAGLQGPENNFQPLDAGQSAQQNGLMSLPGQQFDMSRVNTNTNTDLQQYLKTPQGQANARKYKKMGYEITGFDANGKPQFSKANKVVTGPNKGVQLFNEAASLATGIADTFQEKQHRADEYRQVVKNVAPAFMENMESEGLNNVPAYTMYGGQKKMGGPIKYGEPVGVVDFDSGSGIDDSMYEGIRHNVPYGQSMIYSGEIGEYRAGGQVSAAKAKEILRDGTAQGHPLTDKQKRYFGWLAGGGKQTGGQLKHLHNPRILEQNMDDRGLTSVGFNEDGKEYGYDFLTPQEFQQQFGQPTQIPVPRYNFAQGVVPGASDSLEYKKAFYDQYYGNPKAFRQGMPGQNASAVQNELPTSTELAHLDAQQQMKQRKMKKTGGFIPRYQAGGPNPSPVNPPADQGDTTDDYYKANATLQYFKTQLNNKLRAKNPQAYDKFQSGFSDINNQYRTGKLQPQQLVPTRQAYVQNSDYDIALSPEDVQGALGDQYQTYLNSLQTVNKYNIQKGQQPLYGTIEGDQDVTKLNYGRRFASVTTNPSIDATLKKASGATERRRKTYTYDPNSKQVNLNEVMLDDSGNVVQPGQGGTKQAGGYAVGQEVHLTKAQIRDLKKQGYKIEEL